MVRVRKEAKIVILILAVVIGVRFAVHLLFFRPYNEAELQRYLYGPFGEATAGLGQDDVPDLLKDYLYALNEKGYYSRNKIISGAMLRYVFSLNVKAFSDGPFDAADNLALCVFPPDSVSSELKQKLLWISRSYRLRRALSEKKLFYYDLVLSSYRYNRQTILELCTEKMGKDFFELSSYELFILAVLVRDAYLAVNEDDFAFVLGVCSEYEKQLKKAGFRFSDAFYRDKDVFSKSGIAD